jgi:hypothetical protein
MNRPLHKKVDFSHPKDIESHTALRPTPPSIVIGSTSPEFTFGFIICANKDLLIILLNVIATMS